MIRIFLNKRPNTALVPDIRILNTEPNNASILFRFKQLLEELLSPITSITNKQILSQSGYGNPNPV